MPWNMHTVWLCFYFVPMACLVDACWLICTCTPGQAPLLCQCLWRNNGGWRSRWQIPNPNKTWQSVNRVHSSSDMLYLGRPSYLHELTLIPWINNHIHYKMWDEIIYPFTSFNDCTVEVWEWINNFTPLFIGHTITYPWDPSESISLKGAPGVYAW